MTWAKGQDIIDELVGLRRLQRVTASRESAERLLDDARRHLVSAHVLATDDPQGAYTLVYDAARKALAAVLEAQGLRATATGATSYSRTPWRHSSSRLSVTCSSRSIG